MLVNRPIGEDRAGYTIGPTPHPLVCSQRSASRANPTIIQGPLPPPLDTELLYVEEDGGVDKGETCDRPIQGQDILEPTIQAKAHPLDTAVSARHKYKSWHFSFEIKHFTSFFTNSISTHI